MREQHVSIDKAENGFVLYLSRPAKDKDEFHPQDTYICSTLDEALKKVEDYFTV